MVGDNQGLSGAPTNLLEAAVRCDAATQEISRVVGIVPTKIAAFIILIKGIA